VQVVTATGDVVTVEDADADAVVDDVDGTVPVVAVVGEGPELDVVTAVDGPFEQAESASAATRTPKIAAGRRAVLRAVLRALLRAVGGGEAKGEMVPTL
jgi:hypothetical protein